MTEPGVSDAAQGRAERRRFVRVHVDLPGRLFEPADAREAPCKIINLSPGGASVATEFQAELGAQIVLYVDGFGRFEGTVARRDSSSFGLQFTNTQLKRERTAEQLKKFGSKTLSDDSILRRHERTPTKGLAHFTRSDGSLVKCSVLDLSPSGVSVRTIERPAIGEFVLIGKLAGRVARHHANGIGIEFVGLRAEEPTVAHLLTKGAAPR